MLSKNWSNPTYYPPFMGIFNLSPRDRIIHAVAIFIFGSFITSYKTLYIFEQIKNEELNHDKISSWYILPFVFLSFFLIQRIIALKPLERLKEKEMSNGGFPWKYFILGTIYDISVFLLIKTVYLIFVIIFAMNIWM